MAWNFAWREPSKRMAYGEKETAPAEVTVAGVKTKLNEAEPTLAYYDGGVAQGERGCGGDQDAWQQDSGVV